MNEMIVNKAHAELSQSNHLQIIGKVTLYNVNHVCQQARKLIDQKNVTQIDLTSVLQSDSAVLLLLIDLVRYGELLGRHLVIHAMPEKVKAMAEITGLERLLPISE